LPPDDPTFVERAKRLFTAMGDESAAGAEKALR
jgi:hypothetical protein